MLFRSPRFGNVDVKVERKETLFEGFSKLIRVNLRHKLFAGGWSNLLERELFDRGSACAVLLYDPERDLVGLVEQFRVGALESEYGPWCLEVVAGLIDPGETPEQVARREVAEEAGVTDVELTFITDYYTTPGACNERVHLFYGRCNLEALGGVHGLKHENEDIQLHIVSADQAISAMYDSRLNNASTLLALQWMAVNRPRLSQRQA